MSRDLRKDFKWKRERPIGPHKHKPPNLAKWGGVQTMNPDYKRVVSASKSKKGNLSLFIDMDERSYRN